MASHTLTFIKDMKDNNIDINKYDTNILLEAFYEYLISANPDKRASYALRVFNKGKEIL
jgi:hypothetical protein